MTSEDLLDYFKLEAEVHPTHTIHYSFKFNRALGVREKLETKWNREEKSIGRGTFGEVWKELQEQPDHSQPNDPQSVRAVKVIKKRRMHHADIDFKRELLALAVLSREKYRQMEVLVTFYHWFEDEKRVYLAMEYLKHGDLSQHVDAIVNEEEVRQITMNLLEGLNIIHSEGFAHRDLKPQNIFVYERPPLAKRWWVKIGDFGISKRVKNDDTAWRTVTGTRIFMAPEVHGIIDDSDGEHAYRNTADLWSLGCVLYYCAAQEVPFKMPRDIGRFCRGTLDFPIEPLLNRLSGPGVTLIRSLLVPEPAQRTTVACGLKDPWLIGGSLPHQHGLTSQIDYDQSRSSIRVPGQEHTTSSDCGSSAAEKQDDAEEHHGWKQPWTSTRIAWGSATSDYGDTKQKGHVHVLQPTPELSGASRDQATGLASKPYMQDDRFRPLPANMQAQSKFNHGTEMQSSSRLRGVDVSTITEHHQPQTTARKPVVASETHPPAEQAAGLSNSLLQRTELSRGALAPRSPLSPPRADIAVDWKKGVTLSGHRYSVWCVTFSPGGKLVASGSSDGTVRLWDTATGKSRHILEGHSGCVNSIAFSPDGKLVASGSSDGSVRLWDIATGEGRHILEGHSGYVNSIAFSPDGKLVASGFSDGSVGLRDIATGKSRHKLEGHLGCVYSIAFSPDGKLVASGSYDRGVGLWDIATGKSRHILEGHSGYVNSIAFSPDGKLVASGSSDRTVRLWDIATGEGRHILEGHSGYVYSIAFSPDGKLVALGSSDGGVGLWDTATTRKGRHILEGHLGFVNSIAFSPDGKLVASGSGDKTVRLWGAVPETLYQKQKKEKEEEEEEAKRRREVKLENSKRKAFKSSLKKILDRGSGSQYSSEDRNVSGEVLSKDL